MVANASNNIGCVDTNMWGASINRNMVDMDAHTAPQFDNKLKPHITNNLCAPPTSDTFSTVGSL